MSVWLGRLCAAAAARAYRGGPVRRAACQAPQRLSVRCSSGGSATTVNYEELKDWLKKDDVVLIDVREPWEIQEYGVIKGSVNIPLGDLVSAFQMTPKDFEEKYKKKLPEKSKTLVFSCLAGIRSAKALQVALSLGYDRAHHYNGGFEDWTKHEVPEKQS